MICPTCGWDNLPGDELCGNCQHDLTALDLPVATNRVEKSLMEDEVEMLELKPPVAIAAGTTIRAAIALMLDRNIGVLLIVDETGKLEGIFSERDLLRKVAGMQENYCDLPVREFMTPRPEAVAPSATLNFVLHKMDGGGYRHVPVVDNGKPVGVVSVRDMLRHITKLCREGVASN